MNIFLDTGKNFSPSKNALDRLKRILFKHINEKNDYQNIVKIIYDNRDESNEYILGLLLEEDFYSLSVEEINKILNWLKQLVDL